MSHLYTRHEEHLDTVVTDFGFVDQKGRKCGYSVYFAKVILTEKPGAMSGYGRPDGLNVEHFTITTTPTRNGRGYGPAFNRFAANTLQEVQAVAAKRMAQARKRDAKKFNAV